MKNKIFLTSAFAMCVATTAMAEMTDSNSFPNANNNEYMQANTRYIGAATSTNMAGVYENSVYANAQYTTNNYTVSAGTYLPADAEATATCTAGSFCPGLQSPVQYNATTAQGINACPTGYTNSAQGATSNTQCYRTCASNDVPHSTGTLNGGVYYNGTNGDGTNACEPTACVNGWHLKPGLDLSTEIGDTAGVNSAYVNNSGSFSEYGASNGQSYYGISGNNTWAVEYRDSKGIVTGQARCSTQPGDNNNWSWTNPTITSSLTDETGQNGAQYCYCTVTGYTPVGGDITTLAAPWVFYGDYGSASNCANDCAYNCAYNMRGPNSNTLAFRAAVFGAIESSPASCEANTITINWSDADLADVTANEAGTVTYGGDVRTPVKAQTKKGKTFSGWVFSTTAPTE